MCLCLFYVDLCLAMRCLVCRVASGDTSGQVVIYDVLRGQVFSRLSEAAQSCGMDEVAAQECGGVVSLAWCGYPARLAVLFTSGLLLLWDVKGEFIDSDAWVRC